MNWIVQKLELQIIITKPNFIIQDPKRIGSVPSKGSPFRSFQANLKSEYDPDSIYKIIRYSGSHRSTIRSVRSLGRN
jgi:hypothetical protein